MGFVTVGENENHALAEFSKSLRDSIKIINAKIACGPECNISIHESQKEQCNVSLEHLERVGLLSKKTTSIGQTLGLRLQ
jgi:hypothetical protein